MGWQDVLSTIGRYASKPQGALAGGLLGAGRWFGIADPESGYEQNIKDPLSGILHGFNHNVAPHDLLNEAAGNRDENIGRKVANFGFDLGLDPFLLAGPAGKAGRLGKLAEGAATAGKVETDATGLAKFIQPEVLGQFGRRAYQSSLATGTPLAAPLVGVAERGGLAARRAIEGLLARRAPGNITEVTDIADVLKGSTTKLPDTQTLLRNAAEETDLTQGALFGSDVPLSSAPASMPPVGAVKPEIPGQLGIFDSRDEDLASKLMSALQGDPKSRAIARAQARIARGPAKLPGMFDEEEFKRLSRIANRTAA